MHPITKASLEISNAIKPILRSPGRKVRLIESGEIEPEAKITSTSSGTNISGIINLCRELRQPISTEDASRYIVNKKVSLKLVSSTKTVWKNKQPECPLFGKQLDAMNYDELMEIYRLTALHYNMSIYFVESFYNNLFAKIPMKFTAAQISSIQALYPNMEFPVPVDTLIYVYTVHDGLAKNYFATDFVYNKNTMRMLNLRDNTPKDWERKDIESINDRVIDLESYLKSISVNEYSLKYVSDMLLYYLGIKLPEIIRIDYKVEGIKPVRNLKSYAFKAVTGTPISQVIYDPSTYFLYNNIKYENIELFVLRNLIRGGPKNYAHLLAINAKTSLDIHIPPLGSFVSYLRSKTQTRTVTREHFIKQVAKYYRKIFHVTLNNIQL